MATQTNGFNVFAYRYRQVSKRLQANEKGCYEELQELLYLVTHSPDTSPEQEAYRVPEALRAGYRVQGCYCARRTNPIGLQLPHKAGGEWF